MNKICLLDLPSNLQNAAKLASNLFGFNLTKWICNISKNFNLKYLSDLIFLSK